MTDASFVIVIDALTTGVTTGTALLAQGFSAPGLTLLQRCAAALAIMEADSVLRQPQIDRPKLTEPGMQP